MSSLSRFQFQWWSKFFIFVVPSSWFVNVEFDSIEMAIKGKRECSFCYVMWKKGREEKKSKIQMTILTKSIFIDADDEREPFERSFNKNDFSVSHIFWKESIRATHCSLKSPSSTFIHLYINFYWEKWWRTKKKRETKKKFFQVHKSSLLLSSKEFYLTEISGKYVSGFRIAAYVNEIFSDTTM